MIGYVYHRVGDQNGPYIVLTPAASDDAVTPGWMLERLLDGNRDRIWVSVEDLADQQKWRRRQET